ncbi:MAG TPA: hypothetical protein VHA13_02360, partial [Gammaproteobacteria bacterium]|nr:hypothetical protein [Gammaproteobacteria bacterium]
MAAKILPVDKVDTMQAPEERMVISAYFCGSGVELACQDAIAGKLYSSTITSSNQIAMGYTGCFFSHGFFAGMLFGAGTVENAQKVADQALILVRQGKRVTVNCYGYSRGAISALLVAKMLGHVDECLLEVNLALLDPVPGNFTTSVALDAFDVTLANQVIDLRRSRNLKHVLSFYATHHLFALTPVVPLYPSHTELQEKTLAGDHNDFEGIYLAGCGVYSYVHEFLKQHGTQFNHEPSVEDEIWRDQPGDSYAGDRSKKSTHSKQNVYIEHNGETHGLYTKKEKRHIKKSQLILKSEEDANLYLRFVGELLVEVEKHYPKTKQVEILRLIKKNADFNIPFADINQFKNSLRIVLALALQRHNTLHDLIATTDLGYKALALLRKPEYAKFAELVLGYSGPKLRYRDLRLFVLGENDEQYFISRNSERTFKFLGKPESITHQFSFAYWL